MEVQYICVYAYMYAYIYVYGYVYIKNNNQFRPSPSWIFGFSTKILIQRTSSFYLWFDLVMVLFVKSRLLKLDITKRAAMLTLQPDVMCRCRGNEWRSSNSSQTSVEVVRLL